jgi:glycosyltransferase involved in cell wall biosynthesis
MRVAIILPRIDQLGPVTVIKNLVNSLSVSEKFKIKVFYFDKDVDQNVKMIVPVARIDRWNFCFSDYDIIHTSGIRPDLFAFLNRKKIKYHISTIHNFVFDDLAFTYNRLISWIFGSAWLILWKRADKLVCVSRAMKNYYLKWFPDTKLEVIYNGIEETDHTFQSDHDLIRSIDRFHSQGLKVLGSAGILTKRKGADQILYLIAAEKELALLIIGDGKELARLIHLSEKLKINERCLFCGFRSNAVSYFRYFDLFIMPSRSEGFGLTLIEAVQQKVPVICSDIPVFKELFKSEEVTFFKLEDLTSLTEAIKLAIETGKRKVELAYSRYLNNYTALLMAKSYYELYRST